MPLRVPRDPSRLDKPRKLTSQSVLAGIEQQPRYNLTVSISLDSGHTWPHRQIIYPAHMGRVGYSDCRVAKDGTIVVHFE